MDAKNEWEKNLYVYCVLALAAVGALVVMKEMYKLLKIMKEKCCGRRRGTVMEELGIAELYQAPSRGRVHSDRSC